MIYFPETIIQWVRCYWGYLHTIFLLAMHVNTHSVHNLILKPWRGRLLRVFSSCHVFSPPLSGLNWRSLTPAGFAHTPLLGSRTITIFGGQRWEQISSTTLSQKQFGNIKEGRIEPFSSQTIPGACKKFFIFSTNFGYTCEDCWKFFLIHQFM